MRPMLTATLCLLPVMAVAENPMCAPTGEIVALAVEARKSGEEAPAAITAITAITAEMTGDMSTYAPAVQPLVDWVYSLDEAQLAEDVAGSYVTQCEAQ